MTDFKLLKHMRMMKDRRARRIAARIAVAMYNAAARRLVADNAKGIRICQKHANTM